MAGHQIAVVSEIVLVESKQGIGAPVGCTIAHIDNAGQR